MAASGRLAHRNGIYFKGHTEITEITEIFASLAVLLVACMLCAARAEGTFCDFRDFCVKIYNPLFREIDAVVINDEPHGTAAKFPGIRRDT